MTRTHRIVVAAAALGFSAVLLSAGTLRPFPDDGPEPGTEVVVEFKRNELGVASEPGRFGQAIWAVYLRGTVVSTSEQWLVLETSGQALMGGSRDVSGKRRTWIPKASILVVEELPEAANR